VIHRYTSFSLEEHKDKKTQPDRPARLSRLSIELIAPVVHAVPIFLETRRNFKVFKGCVIIIRLLTIEFRLFSRHALTSFAINHYIRKWGVPIIQPTRVSP
jgi:hypothetical protein